MECGIEYNRCMAKDSKGRIDENLPNSYELPFNPYRFLFSTYVLLFSLRASENDVPKSVW
ncbi:hypothetical protein J1N35_010442 [Gossypium stocksii]|uniref:Uncharacterized protein n=1 Tax=Gossypium stocksii TaxID=47602 RepID=A0A9D3W0F9_9ROSI|nr:hypothetical protein J1N35_010442 [Gossypium stocksii]